MIKEGDLKVVLQDISRLPVLKETARHYGIGSAINIATTDEEFRRAMDLYMDLSTHLKQENRKFSKEGYSPLQVAHAAAVFLAKFSTTTDNQLCCTFPEGYIGSLALEISDTRVAKHE